jgi:hypothetical protein
MALAIDNTLSATTSNSYCDIAYADSYWAGHFNTARAAQWAALNTAQKTMALIQATRVIETCRFTVYAHLRDSYRMVYDQRGHNVLTLADEIIPVKFFFYQTLQFPRNLDRDIITGVNFIPEPILEGQCEQAVYLLTYDETVAEKALQGVETDLVQVGSIHTKGKYRENGTALAPMAKELVRQFWLTSTVTMRRG